MEKNQKLFNMKKMIILQKRLIKENLHQYFLILAAESCTLAGKILIKNKLMNTEMKLVNQLKQIEKFGLKIALNASYFKFKGLNSTKIMCKLQRIILILNLIKKYILIDFYMIILKKYCLTELKLMN